VEDGLVWNVGQHAQVVVQVLIVKTQGKLRLWNFEGNEFDLSVGQLMLRLGGAATRTWLNGSSSMGDNKSLWASPSGGWR